VSFCLERSPEMVVGILGILKAGGTYVPLDPAYPKERLAFMLEDTRTPVIVAQQRLVERLPEHQARVVRIDADWELMAQESEANRASGATAGHQAYVMYTSGSTGRPKGIAIPHRAINRLVFNTNYIELTSEDRMALASNSAFDAATFELWGALLHGGRLVGISRDVALSPADLAAEIRAQGISAMFLTTALFNQIAREAPAAFGTMRSLLFGGEAVDLNLVKEVLKHKPPARLLHVYGPTESTTFTTWYLVQGLPEGAVTVPIGRPLANTQVYLLDGSLQPAPVGIAGELCIGGEGLAWGYFERPELTAERFIPNPYSQEPGARLYRTGDLARYWPDGAIEFLGRLDQQVKIRGFRIELGEIEAVLAGHPAIRESVVLAREDSPGEKRLIAYLVNAFGVPPSGGLNSDRLKAELQTELSISELREFLREKLPEYMTPSVFVELDALPLTPNGKVDRQALPAPDSVNLARPELAGVYVAPRTLVEETLAGIWSKVLGVNQVGVHDSFFDLGGHSLLATQAISRVREAFRLEMPLRSLFEAPTVAGLAESVEAAMRAAQGQNAPPIVTVSRTGRLPLSFAQQRLWFMDQLEPGNPAYNIPSAIRLSGEVNIAALERSLNEITRRHESLRTTFVTAEGQPAQIIAPHTPRTLPLIDLSELSESEREAQVGKLVAEEAVRPFDLSRGSLFRIHLLKLEETEHIALFSMHHIISDEWSLGVLAQELAALYAAFRQGQPSPLTEPPIQYADFAHWQREWLQGEALEAQLGYWRDRLGGKFPALQLPFDHPRPAAPKYRGATRSFALSSEVSASLRALSREEGATLFMTLLAALQTLLHRITGQDDIVVGTDVANRNRLATEGLIGFFVNHLVLRADLSGNPGFRRLLRQAREVTLGAYAHQDLPFDKLVSALRLERNPGQTPLFQVLFVFGNPGLPTLELPGLTLSPLRSDLTLSKYDLTLFMSDKGQSIGGLWRYSTELFEAGAIERLCVHFETLLGNIAANPDARLDRLEILTEAERQRQDVEGRERREARARKLRSVNRESVDLGDADSALRA
jgi:amino acid adenylation domain-containing protein